MSLTMRDVTRRFGDVVALNRVTLHADAGVTALVGPNGSGKSTLMKLATGHVRPTAGTVTAFGRPIWDNPAVLRRIGYVPEQDALYENMGGLDMVASLGEVSGLKRVEARRRAEDELAALGLTEGLERPVKTYSKGQRQRVKLAQALLDRPSLLLLDEPLLGCDPVARRRIQDRMASLGREGCTVLVSTHILREVEQVTRDIAVLSKGRLVARGHAGEVRNILTEIPSRVRVHCRMPRQAAVGLAAWPDVASITVAASHVDVETTALKGFLTRLQVEAPKAWRLTGHEAMDSDLESLFGYLAGGAA